MSARDLNLDDLTPELFEELVQELVLGVLGKGFQFPEGGSDGGRDGYFDGSVCYDGVVWEGYHVVQAKFRRRTGDPGKAPDGEWAAQKLRQELNLLFDSKPGGRRRPDFYYFATNARLGSTRGHGSLDKLETILEARKSPDGLKRYAVWGYKKLCALLANHPELRTRYGLTSPVERRLSGMKSSREPPVPGREPLKKLTRLSDVGWKDAAVIEEGDRAVRLEELYVARTVENEILEKLLQPTARGKPQRIFVVGDAGYGKTSLLWHIAKSLRESSGRTAFFLKATSLDLTNELPTANHLTVSELEAATALATREANGRGVVLLLDTLDLQVRDEARRDAILAALDILTDAGCEVVASCRPQEFSVLGPRRGLRIELQNYGPEELKEAVRKHVRWAYWDKEGSDWENQLAWIQDAVTAGRPVREICGNPLTLRMLFSLYRPNLVPLEIHQFALYREFWDLRVKRDVRAGMPIGSGENLEKGAAIIALAMLGEGDPEVGASILERVLNRHSIPETAINALLARGILRRSVANKIEFFHQTFFEHAAARWLLNQASPMLDEAVRSHIRQNPNDLFLAPVYEQLLLLLLSAGLAHEKVLAQERLVELLQSPHLNHQLSGLYVFAHAPDDLPIASGPLKDFLRTGGPEAVKRYIHLLPNRAFRANRSALEEAEIIWARGDWNLMIGAFELLERLASKDPALVCSFLKGEDRIGQALRTQKRKDTHIVYWPLLRVLDRVAADDPGWFWALLQQIHSEITSEPSKADIIPYIVRIACRHAEIIGLDEFERYFKLGLRMTGNPEEWKRLPAKTSLGYGQVWARLWELKKTSLNSVLAEIRAIHGFQLKMSLAGLAVRILGGGDGTLDPALVWKAFEEDAEVSRRWLWIRVFWHAILERSEEEAHPGVRGLIELLGRNLAASIRRLPNSEAQEFVDQIMETVGDAACSSQVLLLLFSDPAFQTEHCWIACGSLTKKVTQAARAGVLGAQSFLDAIADGRLKEQKENLGPLIHGMTESLPDDLNMKWTLLALGIRWRHLGAILTALDTIREVGQEASVSAETRQRLVDLCFPPIPAKASPEELLQLRLRNTMAFFGWVPLEPLERLLEECKETRHTPRFNLLLRRLEDGCICGYYQVSDVSKESQDVVICLPAHLSKLWSSTLSVCIIRGPETSREMLSQAFDLIIRQGSDFHQLALFGSLLEKWAAIDVGRAISLARDFLTSDPVRALGRSATFRLSHKLQVAFARLITAASHPQQESLLALVPEVHEILGASLVHLMGSHCPEVLKLHMDKMLHDQSINEFVRAMMLKQRKEGVFQNKGYPWLSQALLAS